MSEHYHDKKSFSEHDAILGEIQSEIERIDAITNALAGVALSSANGHHDLIEVSANLATKSNQLLDTVRALEIVESKDFKEPFGDEESYYTVLRLFTQDKNVGTVLSLEHVWEYLSKNYDMTAETPATLRQTLHEWAADIRADARERRGIDGFFGSHEDGFVFSYSSVDALKTDMQKVVKQAVVTKKPVIKKAVIIDEETEEVAPPVIDVKQMIVDAVSRQGEPYKQADLKRFLKEQRIRLSDDEVQAYIDTNVADGLLFKHRRNGNAYLWIEPDNEIVVKKKNVSEKNEKPIHIDIDCAVKIIVVLVAPGSHVEEKLTMQELWRRMNDDRTSRIPEDQLLAIKRVCRQLESIGITEAGEYKYGTGGIRTNSATSSKRRRSASHTTFKVRLASQEVKAELKKLMSENTITESILERFHVIKNV